MSNEELVNEFLDLKKLENRSPEYIKLIEITLKELSKDLNKPYKKANEKDMITHLKQYKTTTMKSRLPIIKMFYRYLFKLNKNETADCLKMINTPSIKHNEVKYRERVILPEEYDLLITAAGSTKIKALIETLYNFGIRRSELISIKIKGVKYEDGKTKITVRKSKTQTRDVLFKGRSKHLLSWVENFHPERDMPESPLFYPTDKNRKKHYSKISINFIIERVCKKAGIKKKITPHDFRHTSITTARNIGTPESHIETNHGLVHGSKQMKTYDHNKTKDYEEWLDKNQTKVKPRYEFLEKEQQMEIDELKDKIDDLEEMVKSLTDLGLKEFIKRT